MILTRTPFRASFCGGGSDVKWFYERRGHGEVLSATIKQYMYIAIHPYFHSKRFRLKYSKTEDVSDVAEIRHDILRACLQRFEMKGGIEISSFADVPAGVGLGSSSAFTVGLLNALYAWHGKVVSKERLAAEACEVEIQILEKPIGKQDQYASAYGGLRTYRFNQDGSVESTPIVLPGQVLSELEARLALYYLSGSRSADIILKEQNSPRKRTEKYETISKLADLVPSLKESLLSGDVDSMGTTLHHGWTLKRGIAPGISNLRIDEAYQKALSAGALGGKLLGAGGTGFLMIYGENQKNVERALGLRSIPFRLDCEGTKLIYCDVD